MVTRVVIVQLPDYFLTAAKQMVRLWKDHPLT
jgi:hypothetical protein